MLSVLRKQIADILTPPSGEEGIPTGIGALDALLPGGGIPRGRLTEILGVSGSGKTTFLRQLVEQTVLADGWIAYIDAARTLAPRDWAHLSEREGVWMIRPTDRTRGAWCADVLLRSGAFTLVVLDGAPVLTRSIAVRLTRLAGESGAAFVVVGDERGGTATQLGGALRLRLLPAGPRRAPGSRSPADRWRRRSPDDATDEVFPPQTALRRMSIAVEKGGGGSGVGSVSRTVEVFSAIGVARRLCSHSEVPDRRGVGSARRADRRGVRPGAAAPAGAEQRQLPRKRRAAEPEFGRERSSLLRPLRAPDGAVHPSRAAARARALG